MKFNEKLNATGKTVWDISEMEEILGEDGMQALSMDEWQYDIENIRQMLWQDNWYSFDLEEVPQRGGQCGIFPLWASTKDIARILPQRQRCYFACTMFRQGLPTAIW